MCQHVCVCYYYLLVLHIGHTTIFNLKLSSIFYKYNTVQYSSCYLLPESGEMSQSLEEKTNSQII